ncbi:MAG: serine hydrolase domain-containing protein [Bacteroidota bacterium]
MKKSSIAFFTFLAFCLQNCVQESIALPVEECNIDFEHNSATHPKAADFQALLDKYVAKGMPGLSMVVYTPEGGKWIGSAGVAKIETQEPMKPCQIFHSASVAKTYHAVAAMSLMEEGRLDIDKTIDTYLPDWVCKDMANRTTATVRQLMNHSSGIPDFIEDTDHTTDYFHDLERVFTTEEYLDYVCGDEATFEAGTSTSYSNTNTVLLALIMDEIAGNHADVITEKIINKLGLKHTFYKNETGYPAPAGAVNTYVDMKGDGRLINSTAIERNFAKMNIGHDAMMASAHDYFLFIRALFEGKLVSQNSVDQMLDFGKYPSIIDFGEGLGLAVSKTPLKNITRAGHDGGSLGAANIVQHYVEKDITIVICSNFGGFLDSPLTELFYSTLIGSQRSILGELELMLLGE